MKKETKNTSTKKKPAHKAPSFKKTRKTAKGISGRILIAGALLLFVGAFLGKWWYDNQPPERQENLQHIALNLLEPLRDTEGGPEIWADLLDRLADGIPASKGKIVETTYRNPSDWKCYAGLPQGPGERLLENLGFAIGYDESRRNPAWVTYRLFYNPSGKLGKRLQRFLVDTRTGAQVQHDDYLNSGYDRGHMAPNYAIGKCYGFRAQKETFLLSNITPQKPNLNRKIWKRLESRVAKRFTKRFESVWVMTGPIYKRAFKKTYLPDTKIEIPEAFYKIIVDEWEPGQIRALAFIIPQTVQGNEPLKAYLASIDEIEKRTGLDFFPQLPELTQRRLESAPQKHVW